MRVFSIKSPLLNFILQMIYQYVIFDQYKDIQPRKSERKKEDITEIEDSLLIYQQHNESNSFSIDNIKKQVQQLHGSFSTSVIYSDLYNQTYNYNELSLGMQLNDVLSVHIQIGRFDEL